MTTAQSTVGGMAAPRKTTKNMDDPRGQFGAFLRHKIDSGVASFSDIAAATGLKERAVYKWAEGTNGPKFSDLQAIAETLGYPNWLAMMSAVKRFTESQ